MDILDAFIIFIKNTFWFFLLAVFFLIVYYYGKHKSNKKLMKISSWLFICWTTVSILIAIYLLFTPACC